MGGQVYKSRGSLFRAHLYIELPLLLIEMVVTWGLMSSYALIINPGGSSGTSLIDLFCPTGTEKGVWGVLTAHSGVSLMSDKIHPVSFGSQPSAIRRLHTTWILLLWTKVGSHSNCFPLLPFCPMMNHSLWVFNVRQMLWAIEILWTRIFKQNVAKSPTIQKKIFLIFSIDICIVSAQVNNLRQNSVFHHMLETLHAQTDYKMSVWQSLALGAANRVSPTADVCST